MNPQTDPEIDIVASVEGFETEPPQAPTEPATEPAKARQDEKRTFKEPDPDRAQLAVGTRVKLLPGDEYGAAGFYSNPVWAGLLGHVGGTVTENDRLTGDGYRYAVRWDHGASNVYREGEIARLSTSEQADAADNVVPPKFKGDEPKPAPAPAFGEWPEAAKRNREAWLTEAARRIAKPGADLSALLFSVGFGKGGTRGKAFMSVSKNAEGDGWQVFIRPTVDGKRLAAESLAEALRQLGHASGNVYDSSTFPDYPQPEVKTEEKKQGTFLIKCLCGKCGYTVRTTARWLDQFGPPICPNLHHPGCVMVRG